MRDATYLWLIGVAVALFFWSVWAHPTFLINTGDITQVYAYYYGLAKDSWDNGEFSFWDPHNYGGMPHRDSVHLFYPVSLLFLLSFKEWYLNYYIIFHILVAGLGMFGFLRVLGFEKQSSFVGSLVFMFSGNLVSRIAGHIPQMTVYSLLPLGFLFLELIVQKKRWLFGIPLTFVLSLQILTGHFQYVFYSFFGLGLYAIYRLASEKAWRGVGLMFLVALLSLLIGLPAFVPALSFLPVLSRTGVTGGDFAYASSMSLPPYHLVTLAMPWSFGGPDSYWGAPNFVELYMYMGIISLAFVLISLWNAAFRHRLFFWILLAISLIIAFGSFTPLFWIVFKLIPAFAYFRTPSRFLMIFGFCFAVLSASGISHVLNKRIRKGVLERILMTGVVAGVLGVTTAALFREMILEFGERLLNNLYFEAYRGTIFVQEHSLQELADLIPKAYSVALYSAVLFTLFFAASLIVLILFLRGIIPKRWFGIAVGAVLLLDVAFFGQVFLQSADIHDVYAENSLVSFLKQSDGRFLSRRPDLVPMHLVGAYNLKNVLGYGASRIIFFDRFLDKGLGIVDETHRKIKWGELIVPKERLETPFVGKLLGMVGTRYIVSDVDLENDDFSLVEVLDGLYVYENTKVLPMAFVVFNVIVEYDLDFARLREESFDPREMVIVEDRFSRNTKPGKTDVKVIERTDNSLRIRVVMDGSGYLVVAENFFPGWKAADNGRETDIMLANGFQRAIWLDEGVHEVTFEYTPPHLRFAVALSLITLFAFLASSVVYLYRHR